MNQQQRIARQALESGLLHVNVSTRHAVSVADLLRALRSPADTLESGDHKLIHALKAFIDETDEAQLIRLARGGAVTWTDLKNAAELVLRPGSEKRDWIFERAS